MNLENNIFKDVLNLQNHDFLSTGIRSTKDIFVSETSSQSSPPHGVKGMKPITDIKEIKSEKYFEENLCEFSQKDKISNLVQNYLNENDVTNGIDQPLCNDILKAVRLCSIYENKKAMANMYVLESLKVHDNINGESDASVVIKSLESINSQLDRGIKIENKNFRFESGSKTYLTTVNNVEITQFESDEDETIVKEKPSPVTISSQNYEIIGSLNAVPFINTRKNFYTPDDLYLHYCVDEFYENKDETNDIIEEFSAEENELDIFPDGIRGLKEDVVDINLTPDLLYHIVALMREKHPDFSIDTILININFLFPKLGSMKTLKDILNNVEEHLGNLEDVDSEEESQTLISLFCMRCCMFSCACERKIDPIPPPVYVSELPFDDSKNTGSCGNDCYKNCGSGMKIVYVYTKKEMMDLELYYKQYGDRSCFIKNTIISEGRELIYCKKIKYFIDTYCNDKSTKEYIKVSNPKFNPNARSVFYTKILKKIQKENKCVDNKVIYIPCKHVGECNEKNDCSCIKSKHPCINICACLPSCKMRFLGCTCSKGKCNTNRCPCVILGWECTPNLCKKCCCDKSIEAPLKDICKNSFVQRGLCKRLEILPSSVGGFGAFAVDTIEKGEFISEYTGELISETESEKRGRIYDSKKTSYLFILNSTQQIDSYDYGNTSRFINHSDTNDNVFGSVIVVNGVQTIVFHAARQILKGEELFFNYNYSTKQKNTIFKNNTL
uniref:[Histone H3]-lysine(27) N-trimethyltransferase n=1 Tax=Parastrongyloides trichosuri TaxID=131310 RepID=A0A0N4ZFL7_PARTI